MDKMAENPKEAKENIKSALKTLTEVSDSRPNSFLVRLFFDAKADEIVSIYTDGPKIDVTEVINSLNRLSPTNSSKWGKISY
jgi:succinyl-CoA synthetase beta subunit